MTVFVSDEQVDSVETEPLRALAELVLAEEALPEDAEATLHLVTEEAIADHNERFLGRKGPTDVLAFPLEHLQPGRLPLGVPGGPPLSLGDVLVAPAYVRRQAKDLGVSFADELALMVVHGMLHLLGYDHENDDDAEAMEERERAVLNRIGVMRR